LGAPNKFSPKKGSKGLKGLVSFGGKNFFVVGGSKVWGPSLPGNAVKAPQNVGRYFPAQKKICGPHKIIIFSKRLWGENSPRLYTGPAKKIFFASFT